MDAVQLDDRRWMPRFFAIWGGQALSLLGSSLVQFALVWWLTEKTGSATILAVATIMAVLPHVIASFFIGPLIDRMDRRRIMIMADSAVAAATAVLMLLFLFDKVQIWHVFIILSVRSLGGSFHQPAMAASTGLLVPDRYLTRVGGMNQALHGLLNIVAPPLGAVLIMLLPMQWVLAIDVVPALTAVLPLLFVSIPSPPRQAARKRGEVSHTSYLHDLSEGFRYIYRWPGLFGLILIAMLLNFLFSPVGSLTPLMVTKVFGLGAIELAWTETAQGAGVILGGAILTAWGGFKKKIATSIAGIFGIGAGILLAGVAPSSMYCLFLTGAFISGFMQAFANGPISAIVQASVDKDMQGRVFSLVSAGAAAMMPIGLLIAGPVSDAFGIRTWFVFGAGVSLLVAAAARMIPAIMDIEENAHSKANAEAQQGQ